MSKTAYYATNARTILICEVKGNRNRGVNDRGQGRWNGKPRWDPCKQTWHDAAHRAGFTLADGYYAVLTLANEDGTDYIVESIVELHYPLDEIKTISYTIHDQQKRRAAIGLRADTDPFFTYSCVTLGLLPDPEVKQPGALDLLIQRVMQGEITNNELLLALLELKKEL